VLGITGTGGAGKSTVTDEILARFLAHFPDLRVAVVAVDPTRRRTGGALLGDRIRMNSLRSERVFMRSIATRRQNLATNAMLASAVSFLRTQGFGLVLVETAGIGQSDSEIVDLADIPVYVMTSEYGAASQLEKIDMLDLASVIVVNKADKRGADDALRDVRKQWKRNRVAFTATDDEIPVFSTVASQFGDPGVNRVFLALCAQLAERAGDGGPAWEPPTGLDVRESKSAAMIPVARTGYLAEIAAGGRGVRTDVETLAAQADLAQHLYESLRALGDQELPPPLEPAATAAAEEPLLDALRSRYNEALDALGTEPLALLRS